MHSATNIYTYINVYILYKLLNLVQILLYCFSIPFIIVVACSSITSFSEHQTNYTSISLSLYHKIPFVFKFDFKTHFN